MRISLLYCLFIIVLSLMPSIRAAQGYPVERTGKLKLFEEVVHASKVDSSRPVVLYDNLRYRHGKESGDYPVLEKGCNRLIPANIVNVNLNMTYLFHSPVKPADDMLGELIYANIELKKMLEKYKSIQKRAVKIAEVSGSPSYVDSPFSIYMPLPEVVIQGSEINLARQKQNAAETDSSSSVSKGGKSFSLASNVKKLENSISRVFAVASPLSVSKSSSPGPEHVESEQTQTAIDVPRPVVIRNSAPEKFVNLASRAQTVTGYSSGYAGRPARYPGSPDTAEANKSKEDRAPRDIAPGELPWWIRAPSEFITYCMNNKIEAGIMLLLFIFVMNIIGSIFRR